MASRFILITPVIRLRGPTYIDRHPLNRRSETVVPVQFFDIGLLYTGPGGIIIKGKYVFVRLDNRIASLSSLAAILCTNATERSAFLG